MPGSRNSYTRRRALALGMAAAGTAVAGVGASGQGRAGADTRAGGAGTNATSYNEAGMAAATPYTLYDEATGCYYAYSTEGADPGWYFAIYRSADLATWEKMPG